MLNLLPLPEPDPRPATPPEPVIRLASLRSALALADTFGGGPASDFDMDEVADGWDDASEAKRRCFDRRSESLLAAASAGLDLVVSHRSAGGDVSPAAMQALADEIRAGLDDIEKLIRD